MSAAFAVATKVEGQHIEAEIVEGRQQGRYMSAIAAVAVTEDQIATRMRMRDQPSGQLNAIGGAKADILEIQTERGRRPLGHRMQRMQSGDEWDEQNQDDNREGTHKPALPRHQAQ